MATSAAHKSRQEYIPGVCNIGPAERQRRRFSGYAGAVVTLALLVILLAVDAPIWWRLLLAIPATGAATGYLQAAMHFCAGFGLKGIYNVMNRAGVVDSVDREEFRRADRRKAMQITFYSFAIGVTVAILALFIP